MSTIGRVFIVLNLVLSAAFLGWAANALSTSGQLREELEAAKKEHVAALKGKDDELAKLQVDLNAVTDQQRTFREEKDRNKAEADRLQTQLDELKRTSDGLQGNLSQITATLGEYNDTIKQLEGQKDAAVQARHEAERARDDAAQKAQDAELAMSAAQEQSNGANTRIGDLEQEKLALQGEVSKLETRIQVMIQNPQLAGVNPEAPPAIDAFVLDVNKDLKLVVLNKGAKDGVKAGYDFDVYKGKQYKGRVRIQNVQSEMSSALIVNEKTAISQGDQATTRL